MRQAQRNGSQGLKVEAGESPALCRNCNRASRRESQDACLDWKLPKPSRDQGGGAWLK